MTKGWNVVGVYAHGVVISRLVIGAIVCSSRYSTGGITNAVIYTICLWDDA